MFCMGIGAYLSEFIKEKLFDKFIVFEIFLLIAGSLSALFLYFIFSINPVFYYPAMFLTIFVVATIVGLELPLLIRLIKEKSNLRVTLSRTFALDYIGALIGAVSFPTILIPVFGVIKAAILTGTFNLISILIVCIFYSKRLDYLKTYIVFTFLITAFLIFTFINESTLEKTIEQRLFRDKIYKVYNSSYQKIIFTKCGADLRLYLNYSIQFSTVDEFRYHEMLIHPAFTAKNGPALRTVLLMGAGDGMALREILKYKEIKEVVLVELDSKMIELFKFDPAFRKLNNDSLWDRRVKIVIGDAFKFLKMNSGKFDLIVADFPDAKNLSLSKLYSKEFYFMVKSRLNKKGYFVTQANSPYMNSKVFYCISKTIHETGLKTLNYHTHIPAFGDWGFVIASLSEVPVIGVHKLKVKTRYLTDDLIKSAITAFGEDEKEPADIKLNSLISPNIVSYYKL